MLCDRLLMLHNGLLMLYNCLYMLRYDLVSFLVLTRAEIYDLLFALFKVCCEFLLLCHRMVSL